MSRDGHIIIIAIILSSVFLGSIILYVTGVGLRRMKDLQPAWHDRVSARRSSALYSGSNYLTMCLFFPHYWPSAFAVPEFSVRLLSAVAGILALFIVFSPRGLIFLRTRVAMCSLSYDISFSLRYFQGTRGGAERDGPPYAVVHALF